MRPELNRTDIKNIAAESERLFHELAAKGVPGLIENNPLLAFERPYDLETAFMLATNDVAAIMIQSNSQHLGQVLIDSAPWPGDPRANLIPKAISAFKNIFAPKATGVVAIPCGTNGCDLYVGEYEIEF